MRSINLEFISKYKYNSVFIKIFIILIVLTLVLMIIFYGFSMQLVENSLKEKTYMSDINMLNKTKNSVDLTLSYIDQMITQVSYNESIISAVVAPGMERHDRNFHAINYLSSMAEKNRLINKIYLYVPYDNSIFSSDGQVIQLKDFSDREIIEGFNQNPYGSSSIKQNITLTEIVIADTAIYMVRDFPFPRSNRMGTLYFKLYEEELYQVIQGDMEVLADNILMFDGKNQPVFPYRGRGRGRGMGTFLN